MIYRKMLLSLKAEKRPWGTAHAVLACRELIDGPFAVINADDYYGPGRFRRHI